TFVLASYYSLFASTDGTHWTGPVVFQVAAIYSIAYGKGLFVGVGANNAVFTSSDGISWANQSLALNPPLQLFSVAYANNRFVAVGGDSTVNSADGTNWTQVYHGTGAALAAVTYGEGLLVAVGYNGGA